MEEQRREEQGMRGKGRGGDPQRLVYTPMSENPEKYRDCKTDLICGGGNTDVCPERQTPSRRHWANTCIV